MPAPASRRRHGPFPPSACSNQPACLPCKARRRAFILFYRSAYLAVDYAPVTALAAALARENFRVRGFYVSSLKDAAACAPLAEQIAAEKPDVILNATAFSARLDGGGGVLDGADAPVLQVIFSGAGIEQWRDAQRGLSAADLAMNVVLPEVDGRIVSRAISFKRAQDKRRVSGILPLAARTRNVACKLRRGAGGGVGATAAQDKQVQETGADPVGLSCQGRSRRLCGGARHEPKHGCDFSRLAAEGYDATEAPADLIEKLQSGPSAATVSLKAYRAFFNGLPPDFCARVKAAWGDPESDLSVRDGAFVFRFLRLGKILVALQPDRGALANRKADYHDGALPPRHGFFAFYLWLRESENIDALIHCGAHGALEWLPGKSVALAEDCAPEIALGPVPLIYPFIVNNPGEAAQAKRRSAAVIVSHLSPPLVKAGAHGATAEIEALFDEYAQAQGLDPRRAKMLADLILQRAESSGLLQECGAKNEEALIQLDAWLCDLKEMRINDGLHVFGHSPDGALRA